MPDTVLRRMSEVYVAYAMDVPIDLFALSSSSERCAGSAKEFETSRVPSRSRPRSRPFALGVVDSAACFKILLTTCRTR